MNPGLSRPFYRSTRATGRQQESLQHHSANGTYARVPMMSSTAFPVSSPRERYPNTVPSSETFQSAGTPFPRSIHDITRTPQSRVSARPIALQPQLPRPPPSPAALPLSLQPQAHNPPHLPSPHASAPASAPSRRPCLPLPTLPLALLPNGPRAPLCS